VALFFWGLTVSHYHFLDVRVNSEPEKSPSPPGRQEPAIHHADPIAMKGGTATHSQGHTFDDARSPNEPVGWNVGASGIAKGDTDTSTTESRKTAPSTPGVFGERA
jgi:hypothetical protein